VRDGDRIIGVLTVCKPQWSMASFMDQTRQRIIFLGLLAAGVVVVLGTLVATWLTHPIQRLTNYAQALRDGRRVPLPKIRASEMATLGKTIEDLHDALEGRNYVENYVQALTHEIKSPVAAIRGAAELLHEPMPDTQRDKFLGNIRAETIRIQEIVDRLLLLSAVEAKKTLDERKPVDLEAALQSALESIRPQADAKGIDLRYESHPEGATVAGDPFLLEKAILNLLQNAVAFAPQGGAVDVEITCQDATCGLTVRDNGPGIPDYAVPRVFERFFSLPRPDTGKKSSGLGLAFVKEVANLHHGTVTLENAPQGGAIARLQLPLREPE
jgi:two-component system sensor histidine kinase CreC